MVAIVLKCYRERERPRERMWSAVDEFTVHDKTADWLAQAILEKYEAEDFIAISDPHEQTGNTADRTDRTIFKQSHITVQRASPVPIRLRHRLSMVNTLLLAKDGIRRLTIACDANRHPKCPKLVESFSHLMMAGDRPDAKKKSIHDLTHWADACGYGLFPFEKLRGSDSVRVIDDQYGRV